MSTPYRRSVLLVATFTALASSSIACSHTSTLERGACSVHFEGARLNGAPVDVDTVEEGGFRFVIESSIFPYHIDPPFQSLQGIMSVSLADERVAWTPRPDELAAFMTEALRALPLKLPNAACEDPKPDTALGHNALEARCKASAQGVGYAMRLRVVPVARGVVIQLASWTNDATKVWADRFWESLKPTDGAAPSASAPSAVPIPVKVIASHLGAVRMQ